MTINYRQFKRILYLTRWNTKLLKLLQLIEEIKSSGDSRYMVLLYHVYIDWYYAHQMTL